jgi:hypothetical protein
MGKKKISMPVLVEDKDGEAASTFTLSQYSAEPTN